MLPQNIECGQIPTALLQSFVDDCPARLQRCVQHLGAIDVYRDSEPYIQIGRNLPRLLLIAQALLRLSHLSSIEIELHRNDYFGVDHLIIFHAVQIDVAHRLTRLVHGGNRCFPFGWQDLLGRLLEQASCLKQLRLEECIFHDEPSSSFLPMIGSHPTLDTLALWDCDFNGKFAAAGPAELLTGRLRRLVVSAASDAPEESWPFVVRMLAWMPRLESLRFYDPTERSPEVPDLRLNSFYASCDHLVDLTIIASNAMEFFGAFAHAPLRSVDLHDFCEVEHWSSAYKDFLLDTKKHLDTLERLTLRAWSPFDEDELDAISTLCALHGVDWTWNDVEIVTDDR